MYREQRERRTSRRAFLAGGSAALAAATGVPAAAQTAAQTTAPATRPAPRDPGDRWTPRDGSAGTATPTAAAVHYLGKDTRLTISMWDFSWLHGSGPGGAFEDMERRVAEAAERGYNTLRIDCFIAHIPSPRESRFEKNWEGVGLPRWGQTPATFTCNVRERVANLADLCRKHGIWLGLDSWRAVPGGGPWTAENEEKAFTGFGEKWAEALRLMREDGVLERAVWVAPLNEVPLYCARTVQALIDLGNQPEHEGGTEMVKRQEEDEIFLRLNRYMAAPIKAEIAGDNIPISYSSLTAEDYAARLTDDYDVVDIHFMPSVITDEEDDEALEQAGRGASGFPRFPELQRFDLKVYSAAWDAACRKNYERMLRRAYHYHVNALNHLTLPSGKRLQSVITESFGPCYWPVHPDVNHEWYKRYNADALRVIAGLPINGTSLSNYAEPVFPVMWDDVDWHWLPNSYFLAQSEAAARAGY